MHETGPEPAGSPPLPDDSRDLAQQYLDIVGVILVALDAHGNITLLNRKGHEVLEYPEGIADWQELDRDLLARARAGHGGVDHSVN